MHTVHIKKTPKALSLFDYYTLSLFALAKQLSNIARFYVIWN